MMGALIQMTAKSERGHSGMAGEDYREIDASQSQLFSMQISGF
jgi:hypothetical protein